jgi:hypothetical protein
MTSRFRCPVGMAQLVILLLPMKRIDTTPLTKLLYNESSLIPLKKVLPRTLPSFDSGGVDVPRTNTGRELECCRRANCSDSLSVGVIYSRRFR